MKQTAFALALAVTSMIVATPAMAQAAEEGSWGDRRLAAEAIATGHEDAAIARLEQQREATPRDPGVLINLGIAYAYRGDETRARTLFEAALASPEPVDLATADGKTSDSRRVARKALRMLEDGQFVSATNRVTLRN